MFNFLKKKEKFSEKVSQSYKHLTDLKSNLDLRVSNFKKDRNAKASEFVQNDFQALLTAWGMTEADIPQVIRSFKIRIYLFGLLCILGILFVFFGRLFFAFCFFTTGTIGVATTLWRIDILFNKSFQSFWRWILSFFYNHLTPQKMLKEISKNDKSNFDVQLPEVGDETSEIEEKEEEKGEKE